MSTTQTQQRQDQQPLLDDSSDEDIERGTLPDYAQATQAGQRVGFVGGQKPTLRPGKDPVALCDVSLRMGKFSLTYLFYLSLTF